MPTSDSEQHRKQNCLDAKRLGLSRYFRFSLRTLLVVLTVGCVWLGWYCSVVLERRAVFRMIDSRGGLARTSGNLMFPGPQLSAVRAMLGDVPTQKNIFLADNRDFTESEIRRIQRAFPEATVEVISAARARHGSCANVAEPWPTRDPQRIQYIEPSWPLRGTSTKPAQIQLESATVFRCNGVRCELLGVSESTRPKIRKMALDFSRRWFDSIGNYIAVYNDSNPLQRDDGTCIVWLSGYDSYLSCLNKELVRAGLARVDFSSLGNYEFLVPGKDKDYQERWREELDKASEDHKNGVKPKVLFQWPPTKVDDMELPEVNP